MPGLEETLEANLRVARLTNPGVRAVGIALNTSKLSSAEAHRMCGETSDALGLPCVDPFSMGVGPIIDWINQCRSEEHTSELQSLMRISYAVFCLKKKKKKHKNSKHNTIHNKPHDTTKSTKLRST